MIRILHVVSSLNRSSGVMNVIMNYYRKIDKTKVQFDFLYWKDYKESFENEINELGGNVYNIPTPGFTREYYRGINNFFKNHMRSHKVLHLHEVYLNTFICPIARKYGIEHIIAHSHTTKYSDIKWKAIRNKILCIPLKHNANIYFACSKEAGEFLYGKKLVMEGEVHIINNAIDCQRFRFNKEMRERTRIELGLKNKLIIGHIGRFNEQKNHEFLIDVFYEVCHRKNDCVLMLVGEGPLKNRIEEKINNLKIADRVLLLGQRDDVEYLLQAMDVFVFPSIFEGLGIVLIEAQCTGLRCIASNVVPIEAKVTDNLSFLDLKLGTTIWAENITKNDNRIVRRNESGKIKKRGFDIRNEAKNLEELYLNLS